MCLSFKNCPLHTYIITIFLNSWQDQFMDYLIVSLKLSVCALTCILSGAEMGMLHSCEGAESVGDEK